MNRMVADDTLFPAHLRYVMSAITDALRELDLDALCIAAGNAHPVFQDDQHYPLRLNPWFRWPAPVPAAAGSIFHIRNNELPELILVLPNDYWHAPPALPMAPWTNHVRITAVETAAEALDRVAATTARMAWIGEPSPPRPAWPANPAPLLSRLEQARCRKTAYEISCMRIASLRGARGHLAAATAFRQEASELEIHLAFLAASRQNEADLPYDSIVALNEHAATLHYQYRDAGAPVARHSLLIDAGAAEAGYASDITRTWAARRGEFALLIEGMDGLQQQLCAGVRAGVDWREHHLLAQLLVARLLREAGLLRMEPESAVETGVSATFMPHGLGHLLGLQVHDVGGFQPAAGAALIPRPAGHASLRLTRRLEPGMVVTVEPGVYFIGSLLEKLRGGPHAAGVDWGAVERLSSCGGIRNEDNVVVTESGGENLTRAAFAAAAG